MQQTVRSIFERTVFLSTHQIVAGAFKSLALKQQ
jgi:hypothetical protein